MTSCKDLRKLNRVQNAFSKLGYDPIEIPRIVVVGMQSAGKSSVMEALVKQPILPRGTGLVTRSPVVLQLNQCPMDDERRKKQGIPLEEWGEFLHDEGKVYRMEEICGEITAQTDRIAGTDKGIVKDAITLQLFSPHVVNLTLVDLPGITKVPVGSQPEDIEKQIVELIEDYIKSPLTIILAVVCANTDMTVNDSLKLAREVDPAGDRTVAVVTKVDLMDKGTDARDILSGKVIPVKLGIVGVVNRSQKDINDDKGMAHTRADEKKFFKSNYPDIASKHGIAFLEKRLSELLTHHVNTCLPAVMDKIHEELRECSLSMSNYVAVTDQSVLLRKIISDFTRQFAKLCENGPRDTTGNRLIGGAKICDILHNGFAKTIAAFHPWQAYDTDAVIMAIRQSNGLSPYMFVSPAAFESLMKPQIQKMELPALACVEDVKRELDDTTNRCLSNGLSLRFPLLRRAIIRIAQATVEETSKKAIEMVKDLIAIETGHVTYYRIDVLKSDFIKVLAKLIEDLAGKRGDDGLKVPFNEGKRRDELKHLLETKRDDDAEIRNELNLLEVTASDVKHMTILGQMLDHYFKIVSAAVHDSTSKAVVTFIVNVVRDTINSELCMQLMDASTLDSLFQESAEILEKRADNLKRQTALREALDVLNSADY